MTSLFGKLTISFKIKFEISLCAAIWNTAVQISEIKQKFGEGPIFSGFHWKTVFRLLKINYTLPPSCIFAP